MKAGKHDNPNFNGNKRNVKIYSSGSGFEKDSSDLRFMTKFEGKTEE